MPDIHPRPTLPPVEIFDKVPSLAVELILKRNESTADYVAVVEYWREGDVIRCSAPWERQNSNDWQAGLQRRCVPCERGNIFARVPWPTTSDAGGKDG